MVGRGGCTHARTTGGEGRPQTTCASKKWLLCAAGVISLSRPPQPSLGSPGEELFFSLRRAAAAASHRHRFPTTPRARRSASRTPPPALVSRSQPRRSRQLRGSLFVVRAWPVGPQRRSESSRGGGGRVVGGTSGFMPPTITHSPPTQATSGAGDEGRQSALIMRQLRRPADDFGFMHDGRSTDARK